MGSSLAFPTGKLNSLFQSRCATIRETAKMIRVERKSRAESTREAIIERDEEVRDAIILAMSRITLARKLTKMAK